MSEFEQKYNELLNEVATMRGLQKKYFSCRSSLVLDDCKKAEKKVDKMIEAEILKSSELQQKLFI